MVRFDITTIHGGWRDVKVGYRVQEKDRKNDEE